MLHGTPRVHTARCSHKMPAGFVFKARQATNVHAHAGIRDRQRANTSVTFIQGRHILYVGFEKGLPLHFETAAWRFQKRNRQLDPKWL